MTDERWNVDPVRSDPSEPEVPVWPPVAADDGNSQPPASSYGSWADYQQPAAPSSTGSAGEAQPSAWGAGYPQQFPSDDSPTAVYPATQYPSADSTTAQQPTADNPSGQYAASDTYQGAPAYDAGQSYQSDQAYGGQSYPGQPSWGQPYGGQSDASQTYGQTYAGQSTVGQAYQPYSTGGTQSAYGYGAAYPAGPEAEPEKSKGRGWLPLLLTALLASLIGGGVGTAYTLANDTDEPAPIRTVEAPIRTPASIAVPTPTVGGGSAQPSAKPSAAPPTREIVPGSVASIASALLPSVVQIEVQTKDGRGGSGSGVMIRKDGYILTNNHVVGDASSIKVQLGSRSVTAKLTGTDPENDLAVIQLINPPKGSIVVAELGTVVGLKVGDPVIAIGSPLGLAGTVTSGIISALDRQVLFPSEEGQAQAIYGAIQTDAAINPGNSGGALVDGNGKVIGINSAIASLGRSSGGQAGSIGLGFAIPIDLAADTANQLIATGKAVHPYIGVFPLTIAEDAAAQLQDVAGAFIKSVTPGSPAERGGLRKNDVITAINGTPIISAEQLFSAIRQRKVGDSITVTYSRGGKTAEVTIVLAERPPEE